jgi:CrcB protein
MNAWLWPAALVGIGGFLGTVSRYKLSTFVSGRFPTFIPYGTLTVNLLGCLLLGWIMRHHAQDDWKLFAGTGFMGAFTTFSTFKLESMNLLKNGKAIVWLFYTLLSYTLGLLFVYIGYSI